MRSDAAKALGEIGDAQAVEPLIAIVDADYTDLPHDVRLQMRRAAARGLVALYTSGQLKEENKRLILAQRESLVRRHIDEHGAHSDCAALRSRTHTDMGSGVDFPL